MSQRCTTWTNMMINN